MFNGGSYYNNGKYSRTGSYADNDNSLKNMFIGVSAQGQYIGAYRGYGAMLQYAYQIFLPASALSLGVAGGAKMDTKDYQSLTSEYEPDPIAVTETKYSFESQAGIYWHGAKGYFSLYSPAIMNTNVYLQTGYTVAFDNNDDDNAYQGDEDASPAKKSRWEIHAQAGWIGDNGANNTGHTEKWVAQGATIVTLKGLLGIGVAWQYPKNIAGVATLNFGKINIGYAYQWDGLNPNLVQHEITIRVKFAKKKEID
jgi:hypothetical protein